MGDDISHDGALPKVLVFPPVTGVEKLMIEEENGMEEDTTVDSAMEEIYHPEPEPELPPLRVRPFDPTIYHSCTHVMALGGILRFEDFARGMPEDFLLRERASHLSHDAFESDALVYRGYGPVTTRD
ncbi:hypothetical protein CsSME_00042782 [Camellia sinensis var. sinensis]